MKSLLTLTACRPRRPLGVPVAFNPVNLCLWRKAKRESGTGAILGVPAAHEKQ